MIKSKKAKISWLYIALIILGLLALAFLLALNPQIGEKIKSLLFASIDSFFG